MRGREMQEGVLTAVRAYCLQCSGGSRREVEDCRLRQCPLYPYRSCKAMAVPTAKSKPTQIVGQMDIADFLH